MSILKYFGKKKHAALMTTTSIKGNLDGFKQSFHFACVHVAQSVKKEKDVDKMHVTNSFACVKCGDLR
jgi:hypothetical protein